MLSRRPMSEGFGAYVLVLFVPFSLCFSLQASGALKYCTRAPLLTLRLDNFLKRCCACENLS